jgi:hypothetical protein
VRRYHRLARRFYDSLPEPGSATVEANIVAFASGLLDLLVEALPTIAGLLTEPVLFHRLLDEIHRDELSPQQMQARLGDYLRAEQRLGRIPQTDVTAAETLLMGSVALMALSSFFAPMPHREALTAGLRPIVVTILRGLA